MYAKATLVDRFQVAPDGIISAPVPSGGAALVTGSIGPLTEWHAAWVSGLQLTKTSPYAMFELTPETTGSERVAATWSEARKLLLPELVSCPLFGLGLIKMPDAVGPERSITNWMSASLLKEPHREGT